MPEQIQTAGINRGLPVGQRGSSPRRAARSAAAVVDEGVGSGLGTNGGCVSSLPGSHAGAPIRTRSPKRYQRTPVRVERTAEEQAQARVRQYQLQELAGDILPEERGLNACMRCRVAVADHVEMIWSEGGHADFTHLQTCGSIWLCSPCAAREAERRRKVLARLNERFIQSSGSIWMTTYTVSHHEYDALGELLDHFLAARKKMREGRAGMALRHDFEIVGTISVLEVTWSPENGMHPHVHELVYCRVRDFDAERYEQVARAAWKHAAAKEGLSMNEHGFELQRTYGAVQDYVTKYGHQPASDRVWGAESEMVKGHLKRARRYNGLTPYAMLEEVLDAGEEIRDLREQLEEEECVAQRAEIEGQIAELEKWQKTLRAKFREYARAFKGRKQLNPSRGMQGLWKAAEAEIEREEKEGEREEKYVLVEFYEDQWNEVVRRRVRGGLREEGRTGRPGWVLEYLAAVCEVEVFPEQYTRFEGWRVQTPKGAGKILSVCRCELEGGERWRCSVELEEADADGRRWYACDFVEVTLGRNGG
jgi:hypothetical protein